MSIFRCLYTYVATLVAFFIASFGSVNGVAYAAEPRLVPDVSQRDIRIDSSFTGSELLLFGAIIYPDDMIDKGKVDVAVVLRGPDQRIILREKQRILGIWLNADSREFNSVPGYYAIASSAPLDKIVDQRIADIYELGVNRLQLSPAADIEAGSNTRFNNGLVDLNGRKGLFRQREGEVKITDSVLYRVRLSIPSSVPTGQYIAETFLIKNGKVIQADDSVEITIEKRGFEMFITRLSQDYSLYYGILAVLISIFFGWMAAVIFQRI